MFADNAEVAFGQQKMDIGNPAVLRIFDRDNRMRSAPILDRIERVFEAEARQRQAIGVPLERGAVAVAARRALERHSARRIGGGGLGHFGDAHQRGSRIALHGLRPRAGVFRDQ